MKRNIDEFNPKQVKNKLKEILHFQINSNKDDNLDEFVPKMDRILLARLSNDQIEISHEQSWL